MARLQKSKWQNAYRIPHPKKSALVGWRSKSHGSVSAYPAVPAAIDTSYG
jgi:hypothetical protein